MQTIYIVISQCENSDRPITHGAYRNRAKAENAANAIPGAYVWETILD